MSTWFRHSLVTLPLLLIGLNSHALGTRPAQQWGFFHFKSGAFVAGKPAEGLPFVAVRDGVRPVPVTRGEKLDAVKLPQGSGAVAGICYLQGSGGKLSSGAVYRPVPRMAVAAFDQENTMVAGTETDPEGYFTLVLPAGRYRIVAGESKNVEVEQGKTLLIPMRTGKRLAD